MVLEGENDHTHENINEEEGKNDDKHHKIDRYPQLAVEFRPLVHILAVNGALHHAENMVKHTMKAWSNTNEHWKTKRTQYKVTLQIIKTNPNHERVSFYVKEETY